MNINPKLYYLLFLIFLFVNNENYSQNKNYPQNRFEVSLYAGYSQPMMEAFGSNVTITSDASKVFVDGQNLVNSSNFGTKFGFNLQLSGKYSIIKNGFLKGVANLGYNQLESVYPPLPDGWNYGTRLNMFFLETGLEVKPFSIKNFYPSIYGLIGYNFIGGESYHYAGIDFLIAEFRIGYNVGFNLNYKLSKKIGLFLGYSYNYANWLLKKTNEGSVNDPYGHDIFFRDKASPTNGLNHDRRVVYASILAGVNFYLK